MLVFGVAMPSYSTAATVLLREQVEPDYMGRVFSLFTTRQTSTSPMGMLLVGPLAEVLAIEWILVGTGLLMMAQIVWLLLNRSLVEAGAPVAGGN